MGKWVIDKQFSFCYGHRVWSQKLHSDFCEKNDTQCKCRHLHGHEGLVHVFLEGETLERGMVTDFKHLGWLKNFLDDNMDHKFIIDINDPIFCNLLNVTSSGTTGIHTRSDGTMYVEVIDEDDSTKVFTTLDLVPVYVPGTQHLVGWNLDVHNSDLKFGPEIEVYEGYFLVNFVPTSEHFSKWLFDAVHAKMSTIGVTTTQVDWYETPKSRSSYRAQ